LVNRPSPALGCGWKPAGCGPHAIRVTNHARGGENLLREARGGDHEVVLGLLVGGHEDSVALSDVDVEGVVVVLNHVGPFGLNELQGVALDPEVEGVFEPNIADSVLVSLPGLHGVKGLKPTILAVNVDPNGPADAAPAIQLLFQGSVALAEPVADEHPILIGGIGIGHWNQQTTEDPQTPESTDCALQAGGRVVEISSNLILNLKGRPKNKNKNKTNRVYLLKYNHTKIYIPPESDRYNWFLGQWGTGHPMYHLARSSSCVGHHAM